MEYTPEDQAALEAIRLMRIMNVLPAYRQKILREIGLLNIIAENEFRIGFISDNGHFDSSISAKVFAAIGQIELQHCTSHIVENTEVSYITDTTRYIRALNDAGKYAPGGRRGAIWQSKTKRAAIDCVILTMRHCTIGARFQTSLESPIKGARPGIPAGSKVYIRYRVKYIGVHFDTHLTRVVDTLKDATTYKVEYEYKATGGITDLLLTDLSPLIRGLMALSAAAQ